MRFLLKPAIIIYILFLSSCTDNSAEKENKQPADTTAIEDASRAEEGKEAQNQFSALFTYFRTQDSSFSPDRFEGGEMESGNSLSDTKMDSAHLRPYLPYLLFNGDSSLAIDFVSYNYVITKKKGRTAIEQAGPDTEIALLDYKKGLRKRILFLGSSGTVLEAKWQNNDRIWIAGAEDMGDGKIRPSLWSYDTKTGKKELYRYPDALHVNIGEYAEQRLNDTIRTSPSF